MNIKILDSWLREYVDTKASAKEIAEKLSLTSVSIERVHEFGKDFVYDIEITTNRIDVASVIGIAREAAAVLPQFGLQARFKPLHLSKPDQSKNGVKLIVENDPKLVHRVCAVVLEVNPKPSPKHMQERLEQSDIRNLNNIVDVTNYIMRTIGHPAHVFDYDRIAGNTIKIRESKKGESIKTLDNKTYELSGGDIVAEDAHGTIIDLLGIMGLENSVVTNSTKRVVLFIDNNDTHRIRKTSMEHGIRTEAAQLNEKGVDREGALDALLYGIELYKEIADGRVISNIIDIYPNKIKPKTISVSLDKINTVIGIEVPIKKSVEILESLGFKTQLDGDMLKVNVPSYRLNDMNIQEDIIEEIARVYGYHNIPTLLPPQTSSNIVQLGNSPFYWERRVKEALKYWGYTETYTYSFVSEDLYEGPLEDAIELQNPLSSDWVYMRKTLIPSLLQVIRENKSRETIKIFELANSYTKQESDLPRETLMLAGVLKKKNASFFEVKGLIEQLLDDLSIHEVEFKKRSAGGSGADVFIQKEKIGEIEILDESIIDFELNFDAIRKHTSTKKIYKGIPKYPPIVEDISFILGEHVQTGDVLEEIKKQSKLVVYVSLLDVYENSKTFHIIYQHPERNLTTEEVGEIREKIIGAVKKKFKAEIK